MVKLKRLKILKYRNVKPGTELHFDDGVNLILGQNASGKTTLLALLSVVTRSSFEGIKDEDFELEYAEAVLAPSLWEDSYRIHIKDANDGSTLFKFDTVTDRVDPRARATAFASSVARFASTSRRSSTSSSASSSSMSTATASTPTAARARTSASSTT
ncbi:AAA family ATPase [Nannocystis pusilla]|uniref:AAA family ATPase n=1 Tax=Nannocystis pusilla TaxID=889268 RepID=UPI003BF1B523